jgi:large subunit ribosomal protein L3
VQVTAGVKRAALINKPEAGHLAKAKVEAGRGLWELRVEADQIGDYPSGRRDQGRHLQSKARSSTSRA